MKPKNCWIALKEETLKKFGYSPDQLSDSSPKPVIAKCQVCGAQYKKSNHSVSFQTSVGCMACGRTRASRFNGNHRIGLISTESVSRQGPVKVKCRCCHKMKAFCVAETCQECQRKINAYKRQMAYGNHSEAAI